MPRHAEDEDHDGEQEWSENAFQQMNSYARGIFGRVVLDEAQKIKSRTTMTHRSIFTLDAPTVNLLTPSRPGPSTEMKFSSTIIVLWPSRTSPSTEMKELEERG